ncbi:hypothetical protein NLS1_39130 [Nocardioides sp. LS1]|nr:hypothetical protein NLS1_39130 [Nocardioides sp. LS1]
MTAIMMVLVIGAAAFAVDLGMQRVVRSDAQAVADMVAMDASRLLDGRTAGQIRDGSGGQPKLADAVAASAARNTASLGRVDAVTATLVYLDLDANGAYTPRRAAGTLVAVPDTAVPDAVMVDVTGSVDFAFTPGRGSAHRTAIGKATPYACFRLGSYAAALSGGDSQVVGVFESTVGDALGVNLHAVGYMGLVSTYLNLDGLAAALGVGSADGLASLSNLAVSSLFTASATVLTSQGKTSAAAVMTQLASKVGSGMRVNLPKVLSIGHGSTASAQINALDLVAGTGFAIAQDIANGNNFLDTGVVWAAPHVSNGDVELKVIQAPQEACGQPSTSTVARTAQLSLASTTGFNLPNNVGGLSASIQSDPSSKSGTLAINATLGGASGYLTALQCASGTPATAEKTSVRVSTDLTSADVSLPFRLKGSLDAVGIVPAGVLPPVFTTATLTLDLYLSTAGRITSPATVGAADTTYAVPPRTYQDAEPTNAGAYVSVPSATTTIDPVQSTASLAVKVAGVTTTTTVAVSTLNLTSLISAVNASFIGTSTATVVGNVNAALVPLSKLLGLRVGGADLFGVPHPSCSNPAVVD